MPEPSSSWVHPASSSRAAHTTGTDTGVLSQREVVAEMDLSLAITPCKGTVPSWKGRTNPDGPNGAHGMSAFIFNVTFDCADPKRLAAFWSGVTGYRVANERDDFVALDAPDSRGVRHLIFAQVPEPRVAKSRVHVDLAAREPRVEIARLVVSAPRRLPTTRAMEPVGPSCWIPGGMSSASADRPERQRFGKRAVRAGEERLEP